MCPARASSSPRAAALLPRSCRPRCRTRWCAASWCWHQLRTSATARKPWALLDVRPARSTRRAPSRWARALLRSRLRWLRCASARHSGATAAAPSRRVGTTLSLAPQGRGGRRSSELWRLELRVALRAPRCARHATGRRCCGHGRGERRCGREGWREAAVRLRVNALEPNSSLPRLTPPAAPLAIRTLSSRLAGGVLPRLAGWEPSACQS